MYTNSNTRGNYPVTSRWVAKFFFKKSELESLFENSRIPTQTELTDKAVELLNNRSRV